MNESLIRVVKLSHTSGGCTRSIIVDVDLLIILLWLHNLSLLGRYLTIILLLKLSFKFLNAPLAFFVLFLDTSHLCDGVLQGELGVDLIFSQRLLGQWITAFLLYPFTDGGQLVKVTVDSGGWLYNSLHRDRAGKRLNVCIRI